MRAVLLAVALLLSTPAWSQDSGFYLGGSIGRADMDDFCSANLFRSLQPCSGEDSAWRAFAGWQLNRYLAVEIGYADLGTVSAVFNSVIPGFSDVKVETVAWDVVAVGSLDVVGGLSVFGKLGMYSAEVEASGGTLANPGPPPGPAMFGALEGRKSDLTYGLGLRYAFTAHLSVRAEWQRYRDVTDPEDFGEGTVNVELLSLGLQYRF
jgi:opacity protein-like surface antigen